MVALEASAKVRQHFLAASSLGRWSGVAGKNLERRCPQQARSLGNLHKLEIFEFGTGITPKELIGQFNWASLPSATDKFFAAFRTLPSHFVRLKHRDIARILRWPFSICFVLEVVQVLFPHLAHQFWRCLAHHPFLRVKAVVLYFGLERVECVERN